MGNKHSRKAERKKKIIRATSPGPMISRRYDLDMSKVKVVHKDHNGFDEYCQIFSCI